MKFEPFKRLEFYKFNCKPNIEQYDNIINWCRENSVITTEDSTMETDYHFMMLNDYENPAWKELEEKRGKSLCEFVDVCCGNSIRKIIEDTGHTGCQITSIWTQISTMLSWHEPHSHGSNEYGTRWSFVYYVDVDKDSGHKGTMYWNPGDSHQQEQAFIAECITGNMYVWPSDILHCQPPSGNKKERKIISGNLVLC